MNYQVGLYESPTGALVADHTAMITQLQWATDTGGDKDLTYTALVSPRDAMSLFDRRDILHVRVSRGGEVLWQGRVTGLGVSVESATSVRIQALGYRTAMYDTLYTAMWRDQRLTEWVPLDGGSGERMDLYNRISNDAEIGVSMQARRYTTSMRGRWRYVTPSRSSRSITEARVILEYDIPAGISVRVSRAQSVGGVETTVTTIAGPATDVSVISLFTVLPSDGVTVVYAGLVPTSTVTVASTDEFYVRMSGFFAVSWAQGGTNPIEIPTDLIASINALNPGQLVPSADQMDIISEVAYPDTIVYLDQRPGDIMDELTRPGNGIVPFVWGVDHQRVVFIRDATEVQRTWQIELDTMTMDRLNTNVFNSGYALQTAIDGRQTRSTTLTNADSVTQLDLTRQTFIESPASTFIDDVVRTELDNVSTPIPEIAIVPSRVTLLGAIVEPYRVRAGDAVQLLSLPFIGVDGLARLRQFRVIETRYDAITDRIEIVPEKAPPRLQDVVRP